MKQPLARVILASSLYLTGGTLLAVSLLTVTILLRQQGNTLGVRIQSQSSRTYYISARTPSTAPADYLQYINRKPSYIGQVVSLNLPQQITLSGPNQTQIVLNLQPNATAHYIRDAQTITEEPLTTLQIGDTLSVFTNKETILAIFFARKQ